MCMSVSVRMPAVLMPDPLPTAIVPVLSVPMKQPKILLREPAPSRGGIGGSLPPPGPRGKQFGSVGRMSHGGVVGMDGSGIVGGVGSGRYPPLIDVITIPLPLKPLITRFLIVLSPVTSIRPSMRLPNGLKIGPRVISIRVAPPVPPLISTGSRIGGNSPDSLIVGVPVPTLKNILSTPDD